MSAYLADVAEPDVILAKRPHFGLVAFTVGLARELGLIVYQSPDETDGVPGHVEVKGDKRRRLGVKNAAGKAMKVADA